MTASSWRMLKSNDQSFKIFIAFVILTVLFTLGPSSVAAAVTKEPPAMDSDFPTYPSIKPNVEFWIDIFTKYSKAQSVIHDTKNLGIIYDVIRIDTSETLKGNRKNKKIKKAVIKKYKNILLQLSKGKKPGSKDEKKVAALFTPDTKPSAFKNAAFNLRCQTGLKQQFKDGLSRSGAVIDEFKRIFKSHGLPVDLIYLPCVESSYNFKAYSKFGAAGIWQFTHSTGKRYMKIGYVVDERRDPYISTDAAARLLKKNHAELKEWPLAITAYNHGLAGMLRAQKAKGSYDKIIKSHRSRSFKFASRNFYSEFLAARIVAKNHEKYFGKIVFHKPVTFKTIKTRGYLSIKELSKKLNIPDKKLWALNPSLRKPVFKGQKYIPKGFKLRLPETISISKTHKTLAGIYKKKQKPSRFHRVQKGDTAGSIARTHSVRLHDLILSNGLNHRATIYIGQNLRIPVKGEINIAKTAIKPVIIKPDKTKKEPLRKKQIKNLVKQTPTKVAPEHSKEPMAKPLVNGNKINPYIVTTNLKVIQTYSKNDILIGAIRVEAEETLGHYADWLAIPTKKIRALNKFKYGIPISIDQKIKIPFEKKTILEFEEQRYEFHKEMEEDFFESFIITGLEIYEVRNGDNIWSLCLNELEIPFWLLKKYNPGMNFNSLQPMQKIKYPVINHKKN